MSPDLKKWPDVPGELKSEIEKFVGETALKNAIQQGFYFLRSGNGEKQIRKVVLYPGKEDEINDNQKKQALKENSDWYLVHGLRGCSKQHNKQSGIEYKDPSHRHGIRKNLKINTSKWNFKRKVV